MCVNGLIQLELTRFCSNTECQEGKTDLNTRLHWKMHKEQLELLEKNADKWNIDPNKVGF